MPGAALSHVASGSPPDELSEVLGVAWFLGRRMCSQRANVGKLTRGAPLLGGATAVIGLWHRFAHGETGWGASPLR